MCKVIELFDFIGQARYNLECAETVLSDVYHYFANTGNDPNTENGRFSIAFDFKRNGLLSGIAVDYLAKVRDALAEVEGIKAAALDSEVETES